MHIRTFLDKHRDKPTTANRCKRVFSAVWNVARGWGYTDLPSPSVGIMGYSLGKRVVYITDEVYNAVRNAATEVLRNAMDRAYLTGQRPPDALRMTEDDIVGGHLIVDQGKTKKKLRIVVTGELAALLERIRRKAISQVEHRHLLMNRRNDPLTAGVLRRLFRKAKGKAYLDNPSLESAIRSFWFYDLRAKAADEWATSAALRTLPIFSATIAHVRQADTTVVAERSFAQPSNDERFSELRNFFGFSRN